MSLLSARVLWSLALPILAILALISVAVTAYHSHQAGVLAEGYGWGGVGAK